MQALSSAPATGRLAHTRNRAPRRKCSVNSSSTGQFLDARNQAKKELRLSISRLLNENTPPATADLRRLQAQIDELTSLNSTPDPSASPLINGTWVLLYTAKLSEAAREGNAFQALSGSLYEQVYKYAPVLGGSAVGKKGSGGAVKARNNFQIFDTTRGTVRNLARFEAFQMRGSICVDGTAEVVRSSASGPARLKAMFTSFCLEFGGEERLKLPLTFLPSQAPGQPFSLSGPVGYVDTPYVDEELRISYGDKGSVFIAARKKGLDDEEGDDL